MRRGTSSLGTDVPSEREINRLAARSDEEFWLFERMDEERRQKENYRTRLMEEHEVPEWVYAATVNKDEKVKGSHFGSVTGKRKRKEVVYADTLSDLQWMKAVENGEDMSRIPAKGRRRDHLPSDSNTIASDNVGVEESFPEIQNESFSMPKEKLSEDSLFETPGSAPKRLRQEGISTQRNEYESIRRGDLSEQILSWNTHRKKRSSNLAQSSSFSDSRGQNSNGRGN